MISLRVRVRTQQLAQILGVLKMVSPLGFLVAQVSESRTQPGSFVDRFYKCHSILRRIASSMHYHSRPWVSEKIPKSDLDKNLLANANL